MIDATAGHKTRSPQWIINANDYETRMPNGGLFNLINQYPEKTDELRKLLKTVRDQERTASVL